MIQDNLFIGCNGYVSAINPNTGQELWRTELSSGFFGSTGNKDVNVIENKGTVVAGCSGFLFGLEAGTGKILWKNELTGMGYNDISMSLGGKTVQSMGKPIEEDN